MNSTNCIDSSNSIVCVVGLGYVGLPLAQAFSKNFKVIGFDTDAQKGKPTNKSAVTPKTPDSQLSTCDSKLLTADYSTVDYRL